MSSNITPYLLGFSSNILFGSSSIIFAKFSKSHSPRWVNQIKVSVAFVCFLAAFFTYESYTALPTKGILALIMSGFMGLCVGDFFLLKAFSTLGPARTLVLYSFQPILLGIYGFFFLNQNLNLFQLLSILFMLACVFTFIFERNKITGKWEFFSFFYAFLGIVLDAGGVMLSRQAFEMNLDLGSYQVNLIRSIGALIGFFILRPQNFLTPYHQVTKLNSKDKKLILIASFLGTFLSLSLYLKALKTAHLATLSAISITSPIWVSILDHLIERSWPNRYLIIAFFLFLIGFILMTLGSK